MPLFKSGTFGNPELNGNRCVHQRSEAFHEPNRREKVREIRSDQGTNFVGGKNELIAALQEVDRFHQKLPPKARFRPDHIQDECTRRFTHGRHMGETHSHGALNPFMSFGRILETAR